MYDQTMLLAHRAKEQGVDVIVGTWKYMCVLVSFGAETVQFNLNRSEFRYRCHVFTMLAPFLPEGRESFDFICGWIKEH